MLLLIKFVLFSKRAVIHIWSIRCMCLWELVSFYTYLCICGCGKYVELRGWHDYINNFKTLSFRIYGALCIILHFLEWHLGLVAICSCCGHGKLLYVSWDLTDFEPDKNFLSILFCLSYCSSSSLSSSFLFFLFFYFTCVCVCICFKLYSIVGIHATFSLSLSFLLFPISFFFSSHILS